MDGFFPKPINLTVLRQLIRDKCEIPSTRVKDKPGTGASKKLLGEEIKMERNLSSSRSAMGTVAAAAAAVTNVAVSAAAAITTPSVKGGGGSLEEDLLLGDGEQEEISGESPHEVNNTNRLDRY